MDCDGGKEQPCPQKLTVQLLDGVEVVGLGRSTQECSDWIKHMRDLGVGFFRHEHGRIPSWREKEPFTKVLPDKFNFRQ